jgi:hypothetical protein
MKSIFVTLALLFSGMVGAQVITLQPAPGAGALHQYHDVKTDAVPADPVTIYFINATSTYVYFASGASQNPYDYTAPNSHFQGTGGTLSEVYCSGPLINRGGYYSQDCVTTGRWLTISVAETIKRVCTKSGRGQGCHTTYYLTGGTIEIGSP